MADILGGKLRTRLHRPSARPFVALLSTLVLLLAVACSGGRVGCGF